MARGTGDGRRLATALLDRASSIVAEVDLVRRQLHGDRVEALVVLLRIALQQSPELPRRRHDPGATVGIIGGARLRRDLS